MISEPTHFMRDSCRASCIDLIVTDQPNLILECGVRDSLDNTVKHKIVFCRINVKIPPLPKHVRKIWHFNRANMELIKRAISLVSWDNILNNLNPNQQVDILNTTLLNIMSNFVPNEEKTINPRKPEWLNANIKKMLRKQNKLFKKYKNNGYRQADKIHVERLKKECQDEIIKAKEKYYLNLGSKLADPSTGHKTYWKVLNKFLNKCKISRIPPILEENNFIINCKEKASLFNKYFTDQCTPLVNNSKLPVISLNTNSKISTFVIDLNEINDIIRGLNYKKAHGPDNISINMIKLCGDLLSMPLRQHSRHKYFSRSMETC